MRDAIKTLGDVQNGQHGLLAICRHPGCRHQAAVDIERLVRRVNPEQPLLPARAELHFTDRMRCPACKRRGVTLWVVPRFKRPAPPHIPNYRIIDYGRQEPYGFAEIATAENLMVARGAYTAAALSYPDHWISLMQGAFVLADNRDEGPPTPLQPEDYAAIREAEMGLAMPKA